MRGGSGKFERSSVMRSGSNASAEILDFPGFVGSLSYLQS